MNMNTAIFWRFLWKEYRVMRAFWISMAVLAVLAQLSMTAFPGLTQHAAAWTFCFALVFPALYAVACGATMFVAEKEDGTYEFLRSLPVTAWRLLSSKLAFAVASTVLLVAALWSMAALFSNGRAIDGQSFLEIWATFGLASIEGLAWGILFSLILRRPLQAAVLAIAAGSLTVNMMLWPAARFAREGLSYDLSRYISTVPFRAAIIVIVLLVDGLLVRGWLQTKTPRARRPFLRRRPQPAAVIASEVTLPPSPRRREMLGRLVWQTWRQSRWTMLMIALPGTVAAGFALLVLASLTPFPLVHDLLPVWAAAQVVPSLFGAGVFLADNERRSVRYLADHAVRPRQVWLARELTWLAALLVWSIAVCVLGSFLRGAVGWYGGFWLIGAFLLLAIIGFCCGQLASMLFRSGIIAAFTGVLLALATAVWTVLMRMFEVNVLWSVVPIPLALLFATWLRTPDWILERNTWRGWLRVGAALVLPAAALLIAVPLYRVYQIPDVSPGFSPDEYARSMTPTAEEKKTAEMYLRAGRLLDWPKDREGSPSDPFSRAPKGSELEFLRMNSEPLALALEAAKRPESPPFGRTDGGSEGLITLLEISGRQLESEGKLDDAWERYFAAIQIERSLQNSAWRYYSNSLATYSQLALWAAQPGQTRERIVAAIKQLEQFETTLPPLAEVLKDEYLDIRRLIRGGPDALAGYIERSDPSHLLLWSMLPWERQRALRLLNIVIAEDLRELDYLVSGIKEGKPATRLLWYIQPPAMSQYAEWLNTTPLLSRQYIQVPKGEQLGRRFAREINVRRATRLLMALEAWRVDHHGELPERLDQLVGPYLNRLPLDPYTSRDYVYEPQGVAPPDKFRRNWPLAKPFIWSPGENVRPDTPALSDVNPSDSWPNFRVDDVIIRTGNDIRKGNDWHRATDEFEIWQSGVWFEIP